MPSCRRSRPGAAYQGVLYAGQCEAAAEQGVSLPHRHGQTNTQFILCRGQLRFPDTARVLKALAGPRRGKCADEVPGVMAIAEAALQRCGYVKSVGHAVTISRLVEGNGVRSGEYDWPSSRLWPRFRE